MAAKDREELIRARAHELWELEGRPEGAGERHWSQASAEVDAAKKPAAAKAAPKKAAPAKAAAPKKAPAKAPAAKKAPAKK